jgi:hypothetical protein
MALTNVYGSFYDIFENWLAFLLCFGAAVILGGILALAYLHTKREVLYTKFMPVAILALTPALATLVGLLNIRNGELEGTSDEIRVGIVLTAGIALTRFRSDKLKIEDMVYLVFSSVVGVVIGIGYVFYGILAAVFLAVLMLILHHYSFGENNSRVLSVRIQVPESLNYENAFDGPLSQHCCSYKLTRTRTVDYGQLYEIRYDIVIRKGESTKVLVDDLRALNGNLQVVVSVAEED